MIIEEEGEEDNKDEKEEDEQTDATDRETVKEDPNAVVFYIENKYCTVCNLE